MEPKEQANLEEDLAVMAHILGKADDGFGGSRPAVAMGIDVFGGQGPAGVRTLYLEGYGILFSLNVGLPLVEPPSAPEEKKDEPRGDSAWEEAKRELHGEGPNVPVAVAPVEAYSAEKVSKLTDTLIEALRNATNIRGLKAEDFVTLCVLGAPVGPSGPPKADTGTARAYGGYGGGYGTVNVVPGAPQSGTILTIRARKSDIDAFAKGKLNADEFRKETRIQRYVDGPAGGLPMGSNAGGFGGGMGGFGGSTRY